MKKSKLLRDLRKNGYQNITSPEELEKYFNEELLVFEISTTARFSARIRQFPKQGYISLEAIGGFRTEIIWDKKTRVNRLEDFLIKKL